MQQNQSLFDVILDWNNAQLHNELDPLVSSLSTDHLTYLKSQAINLAKQAQVDLSDSLFANSQPPRKNLSDAQLAKKTKNKIAAKESRNRKKFYLETIEKETQALQQELRKVEQELEEAKKEVLKASKTSSQNIAGLLNSELACLCQKLKHLLLQGEKPEINAEINLTVDSLLYRFEVLGKERVNLVNKGYNQMLQFSITSFHQYFLWSAKKGCHIFTDNSIDQALESWFEIRPLLNDISIHKDQLMRVKQAIVAQRGEFGRLICALMQKKDEIANLCGEIDLLHHQIREIYTPKQMAQIILLEESLKCKEELKYLQNICQEAELEKLGQPRKMRKP